MKPYFRTFIILVMTLLASITSVSAIELTDKEIENIVRRSYQYVAMYNVINKAAMQKENPMMTGWNGTFTAKGLLDHTMKAIARPNNDTLYVTSTLDLYSEPVIIHYPAFDSKETSKNPSRYCITRTAQRAIQESRLRVSTKC